MLRSIVLLFLCLLPGLATAQPWAGIVASTRAVDWSTAGVEGGIPSDSWTQCGATITPYTGTGQTIQTAINACGTNQYVQLAAGTFTLSSGFTLSKDTVAVRGMGADQTFLLINGESVGGHCGYFYTSAIGICDAPAARNTANWTAGYTQGTTRITLDSTTGITVGSIVFLDQLDDASDGWPAAGDLYICSNAANGCSAQGGGYGFGRSGRAGSHAVRVTNIVGGGQIDITPPVSFPNFRSGQTPGAQWLASASGQVVNVGIEDLSMDYTNIAVDDAVGFEIVDARNWWVKGLRIIYTNQWRHFDFVAINSLFGTIRDNYIYDSYFIPIASYPIEMNNASSILVENNIIHGPSGDMVVNGPFANSVFSYNFTPGHYGPGAILHGGGEMMNLYEGNVTKGVWTDATHGRHAFQTVFRNALIGARYDPGGCSVCNAIAFYTGSQFYNVVGNVMGDPAVYSAYQTGNGSGSSIYDIGWGGSASGQPVADDADVARTLFRWGNWDQVTSTADNTNGDQTGTRWCGNSSNTGWTTRCASTTEVPSGITNFPNPIPATETLPASFYLAAQPNWWPGSIPWPPIGPDVTGGNITNMGGHAYLNPAARCYFTIMGGPADGDSGAPLTFNAGTCYAITVVPEVSIIATDASAAEPSGNDGLFTVSRTGETTGALVVNCAISGTATPTDDYAAISCPVTIPDGQASTTVAVTVQNDVLAGEGTETVIFTITAAGAGEYTIGTASATVNITDDDPLVSVTATDGTAGEPANNGVFTLSCDMACTLTVNCALSGTASAGSDYTAISCPRALVNSDAITVAVLDDGIPEATKNVIFTINAGSGYGIGTNPAQITLTDDDAVILGGGRFSGQGTLQ